MPLGFESKVKLILLLRFRRTRRARLWISFRPIGAVAALFTSLLVDSMLPRFRFSLEVCYALTGAVFIFAAGYAAPPSHRRAISVILVAVGTITLAVLDFRGEP